MLISRILFFAGVITSVVCLATAIVFFDNLATKTLYTYGAVSVVTGVVAMIAFNAIHYYDWRAIEEGRKEHERAYTAAQQRNASFGAGLYDQDERPLLPSQVEALREMRARTARQTPIVAAPQGEQSANLEAYARELRRYGERTHDLTEAEMLELLIPLREGERKLYGSLPGDSSLRREG